MRNQYKFKNLVQIHCLTQQKIVQVLSIRHPQKSYTT